MQIYKNLTNFVKNCVQNFDQQIKIDSSVNKPTKSRLLFYIIIHEIMPVLIDDKRWDLVKLLKTELNDKKVSEFEFLEFEILRKICFYLDSPEDLYQFSKVCPNWQKFGGSLTCWKPLLIKKSKEKFVIFEALKSWLDKEVCVDSNAIKYYKIYKMLENKIETIKYLETEKEIKENEVKMEFLMIGYYSVLFFKKVHFCLFMLLKIKI